MKQMFNIPNLFTASNLMCGVISIILALSGRLEWACYFIYFAAVFDFFDGFLARKLKIAGELGKQLDSLADMVTFGVAPGILVFVMLVVGQFGIERLENFSLMNNEWYNQVDVSPVIYAIIRDYLNGDIDAAQGMIKFVPFLALIIPFFSLFRLAKFNLDTRQSESFIGLPTPANTIFFTAFPLLFVSATFHGELNAIVFDIIQPLYFVPIVVVMSIMLVAELPLFAFKFKDFSWKNNQVRFVFLGSCAILIPFLLAWSIPIIIILYLLLSLIENYRKKTQNEI